MASLIFVCRFSPATERRPFVRKSYAKEELVLISSHHTFARKSHVRAIPGDSHHRLLFQYQPIGRWLSLQFNKRPKKIPVRILHLRPKWLCPLFGKGAGIGVGTEIFGRLAKSTEGTQNYPAEFKKK